MAKYKQTSNGTPKTVDECRAHFNRRWYERVGGDITTKFDSINALVQKKIPDWGKFITFVWKESNTRSHFRVVVRDIPYIIVYNRKIGAATTIFHEHKKDVNIPN